MKQIGKIILFGVLVWFSIFMGAMFIFKLYESDRIFFETLMSIICTFIVVLYTVLYFKKTKSNFQNEGVKIGIIWMIINIMIDIPFFLYGPMAKPIWDYFKDIGFMYISIPVVTIAIGYLLDKKIKQ